MWYTWLIRDQNIQDIFSNRLQIKMTEYIIVVTVQKLLLKPNQPLSLFLQTDPAVPWVFVVSRVPDAQIISERSSYTHRRLHWPRGSLSTHAVFSLTYQGYQGGAAKTLPETTSHGRLPQLRNTVSNPNAG